VPERTSLSSLTLLTVSNCASSIDGTKRRFAGPERSDELCHGNVPSIATGARSGFRVHGPRDPAAGHRRHPSDWVYRHTLPSSPIFATTRFGAVVPPARLRFDASGRAWPHGHAVTKPAVAAAMQVTFSTTALASAGTFVASACHLQRDRLAGVRLTACRSEIHSCVEQPFRLDRMERCAGREVAVDVRDEIGGGLGEQADPPVVPELDHHSVRRRRTLGQVQVRCDRLRLPTRLHREISVEPGSGAVTFKTTASAFDATLVIPRP
jgi:hypothetical protein